MKKEKIPSQVHMRITGNYFVSLSLALLLITAGLMFATEHTRTYTNEDIGFSFDYPSSWKKANVKGGNIVVMFTGGTFNRNVQILYDKGGEEAGKTALERLAEILKTQKELTSEWKNVEGRKAFYQEVEWSSPLGDNRAIRLMVPAGDHYFLVMGVCPAVEFDTLSPLLEKCVLSFKISE